jgi:hypothetical protein
LLSDHTVLFLAGSGSVLLVAALVTAWFIGMIVVINNAVNPPWDAIHEILTKWGAKIAPKRANPWKDGDAKAQAYLSRDTG